MSTLGSEKMNPRMLSDVPPNFLKAPPTQTKEIEIKLMFSEDAVAKLKAMERAREDGKKEVCDKEEEKEKVIATASSSSSAAASVVKVNKRTTHPSDEETARKKEDTITALANPIAHDSSVSVNIGSVESKDASTSSASFLSSSLSPPSASTDTTLMGINKKVRLNQFDDDASQLLQAVQEEKRRSSGMYAKILDSL